MRLFAAALTLLTCSAFAHRAQATAYIDNRGLLPIGEIESFMANTGAALSGSTGAVYYNPAGLASIDRNHIALSANTYLSTHSELNPFQRVDNVDMNFWTEGTQAIPSSFVSVSQSGSLRYALSILIPYQLKVQDSVGFQTTSFPSLQIARTNFFSLLQAGPSLAMSLPSGFDVGAGCFYTMYSTTLSSMLTSTTPTATRALVINSYFDAQVNSLMCNVGLQKPINESWRWGFTARLPSFTVSKKGTASSFVQDPTSGLNNSRGPEGVEPEYRLPMDLTFGLEGKMTDAFRVYADASYQFGTSFASGDFNSPAQEFKPASRVSAGIRYQATAVYDFFGGVGYNASSVQADAMNFAEDYVLGTAGARWTGGNSNLGIGALYAASSGKRDVPVYSAALAQTGTTPGTVSTRAFGVMISSGYLF